MWSTLGGKLDKLWKRSVAKKVRPETVKHSRGKSFCTSVGSQVVSRSVKKTDSVTLSFFTYGIRDTGHMKRDTGKRTRDTDVEC